MCVSNICCSMLRVFIVLSNTADVKARYHSIEVPVNGLLEYDLTTAATATKRSVERIRFEVSPRGSALREFTF